MPARSMSDLRGWRRVPFLHVAALVLLVESLTRVTLGAMTSDVPSTLWPGILLQGLRYDLVMVAAVLIPALIWMALTPTRWRHTRRADAIRLGVTGVLAVLLLVLATAEVLFWDEFSTRFNFIAVDYLVYTQEVLGNIIESYPVGPLLAGLMLVAVCGVVMARPALLRVAPAPASVQARVAAGASAVLLTAMIWAVGDVDGMRGSGNAYADELSGNGAVTFVAAYQRNALDYHRFYATVPAETAAGVLAAAGVPRAAGGADAGLRQPPAQLQHVRAVPRHVVMVMVESLSASYLGVFGNRRGLTPHLDALAAEGLVFTQLYATGTRTVRGLEALTLGTPPIPGQAIVRRPGHAHLTTLGEVVRAQGMTPYFIYGGYGYFDNMTAYFADNDYTVIDRTDMPAASVGFSNAWGVADEYLFGEVLRRMDAGHASGERVLTQVLTTSNHRPYTYPGGRIDIPSPGGRDGAVKYTDWAIGHFIDEARQHPWFADTLFIIVADHCAAVAGRTHLPPTGYHIPMIMYGPSIVTPGRMDRLVSQIDVPPTVLDMLGLDGQSLFFGRSVFGQDRLPHERAFISTYQLLGLLTRDRLVVLGPRQRIEMFGRDEAGGVEPLTPDPALTNEAVAYYQIAADVFESGGLAMPPPATLRLRH